MSRKGLSLLEVVFAIALFSLLFSFVFGVFPVAHRAAAQGRHQVAAMNLAQEQMAVERTKPYDALASSGPVTIPITATLNGVTVVHDYQTRVEVQELEPDRVKSILVTVRWGTTGSKIELETLACKY